MHKREEEGNTHGQGVDDKAWKRRADEYTKFGMDMPHFTGARILILNEISKNLHLDPEPVIESNDLTGAAEGEQRTSMILKALINSRANYLQIVLDVIVFC